MSPLQNPDSPESREHLLSDCPKTIHLLTSYATNLKHISPLKYSEYCSLEANQRWLWIRRRVCGGGGSVEEGCMKLEDELF